MVLNIFSRGLDQHELFSKISNVLQQNNLLLIQDGIYFGCDLENFKQSININIYALKQDVIARGLINTYPTNIKLIDYEDFVNLVLNHEKIITY